MSTNWSYGRPASDAEVDAFIRLAAEAFAVPEADEGHWVRRAGPDKLRLLRVGEAAVAGLARLDDVAQWYGGRRLPACGIASVWTDSIARGRGVGTTLMRALVQELHDEGMPLAILYPATLGIYRRAGFEMAGGRWEARASAVAFDCGDRSLELRRIGPSDREAIRALHRGHLERQAGGLDRNDLFWDRAFEQGQVAVAVRERDGSLAGYVLGRLDRQEKVRLHVQDLIASTPPAATRLLTYVADMRHQVDEVIWRGTPHDPLLALLPEGAESITRRNAWMLRLVDVPGALQLRGWPAGVRGALHLHVHDEVIAANAGRFVLEVEDGAATVRPGGEGRLQVHVRGLAALYSGWMDPAAVELLGLLEGPEADRRLAAALFAGPQPSMSDFF